jgi:hypothetical protein
MADESVRPAGEQSRSLVAELNLSGMTNRIHTRMLGDQTAVSHAPVDRPAIDACLDQLAARDATSLSAGNLADPLVNRARTKVHRATAH